MQLILTIFTLSIDGWMRLPELAGVRRLMLLALLFFALRRALGEERRGYLDYGNLALVLTVLAADLGAGAAEPITVAAAAKIALCALGALSCFAPRLVGWPTFIEQKAGKRFDRLPPLFVQLNALWLGVFATLGAVSVAAQTAAVEHGWVLSAAILVVGFVGNVALLSRAQRQRA